MISTVFFSVAIDTVRIKKYLKDQANFNCVCISINNDDREGRSRFNLELSLEPLAIETVHLVIGA